MSSARRSSGRKPSGGRARSKPPRDEGMWRKFGRRAGKAGKFGWKHRKRAFGLLAGLAAVYVAVYFAYVGTVTVVQVTVLALAVVGSALATHHENMKVRRQLADQPKPSFRDQKQWARGRATPHARPEPTPDTVYVRSHRKDGASVGGYTRTAPGRGASADLVPDMEFDEREQWIRNGGKGGHG